MTPYHPRAVTLLQFSPVFILFGVLLVAALLWPESTGDLNLNRTRAAIWATTVLLNVALVLHPFRTMSPALNNLAGLSWSFAWLIFLAHAYWAVFVFYNGVADTFTQMGPVIASINFFLVIWWSLDVLLLWIVAAEPRWLDIAHLAARVFAFIVFAATLVILRGGSARVLGIVFTGTVAAALAVSVFARTRNAAGRLPTS